MRGLTPRALAAADPEIVCLISGDDETFAQTVHAKTSYDKADIVWGARFRDMYLPTPITWPSTQAAARLRAGGLARGGLNSTESRRVLAQVSGRGPNPQPEIRNPQSFL